MMIMISQFALTATLLTALCVILAAVAYVHTENGGLVRCARWGIALMAVLLSVSSAGLLQALLQDNFSLNYVVQHSERQLGTLYKIAAFWAGQEGSLLLWAWMLGVMGVLMAWRLRKSDTRETAFSLAAMATVIGFFACVMVFAGDPFAAATDRVTDGMGLNPLLQNFAMVAHPPMLFLGYAGFTVPFALLCGALLAGDRKSGWLAQARPWIVFSWIALTVGIVLGAQWAYVELGWGGYWAWDPVENASLLPWLTGTALLHSAILQGQRGVFKRWTAALVAISFFLCILGTYLTRSGVIQSVHAFEASAIGKFFLVFLVLIGLFTVGMMLVRLEMLKSEHPLTHLLTRDGLFLAGNVLLMLMTAATLIGTVYPLLSSAAGSTAITVGAPFYNRVVLPMGLALAALMSLGPTLGHGADAVQRAKKRIGVTGIAAALAGIGTAILGYTSVWAIGSAAVAAAVLAAFGMDVAAAVRGAAQGGAGKLTALARAFTRRPGHWGAQLAHIGITALIVGVMGSSLYNAKQDITLRPGAAAAEVGPYQVRLAGVEQVRRANHTAVVATLQFSRDGQTLTLSPERRFYDRGTDPGQSASVVAIRLGLGRDLYVSLAGWDEKMVTVEAIINPLVNWIWIGGILMTLGGMVSLMGLIKRAAVAVPEQKKAPPVRQHAKTARDLRRAKLVPSGFTEGRRTA